jgi:hypothetical protein
MADNVIIIGVENIFVKDYSLNTDTANIIDVVPKTASKKMHNSLTNKVKKHKKQSKNKSKILYNSCPVVPAHSIMAATNGTAAIVPTTNRLEHNALHISLFFYNYYLFYFTKPTSKERTNFYIADISSNFGIRPPPFEV